MADIWVWSIDTVFCTGCYPFYQKDPFILEECPDVYFSGNAPSFESKLINGQCVLCTCTHKKLVGQWSFFRLSKLTKYWHYYWIWTALTNVPQYCFFSPCQVLMARKSFWLQFQSSAALKRHVWSIYALLHVSQWASRPSPLMTMRKMRWMSATEDRSSFFFMLLFINRLATLWNIGLSIDIHLQMWYNFKFKLNLSRRCKFNLFLYSSIS